LVTMQSCVDLICVQFHPTPNKTIMETISSWLFCVLNDATKKPITVNVVHSSWRGWGGESSYSIGSWAQLVKFSHDTSFGGFVFWSMGRPTKKDILKVTSRPQILLWQEVIRNPTYQAVFFTCATPLLWGSGSLV
jgi:hypothetical protein